MEQTTLIVDCNYICFRSMLRMKELSYEQQPTGVVYGFLRQLQSLVTRFERDSKPRFIFAWDSERSHRREVYPEYKRKTKQHDPEMEELLSISKPQFRELRCNILPRLGFKNGFLQTGIEADDIIAIIVRDHWKYFDGKIVIISADNDLFQLLKPDVLMYDPRSKATYTEDDFIKEKGIPPSLWYKVKAIGGCNSDNIGGVHGVAEITAIKYLTDKLMGSKKKEIDHFMSTPRYELNVSLVKLPHPKTQIITLKKDEFNIQEFENICLNKGFHSLLSKEAYKKWREILTD
jgi:DNA polymerase I